MNAMNAVVGVTGLNATDNPGPGLSVIRSLRHTDAFKGRIVGLAYDSLDPGIYSSQWVDDVFLIPYPSQGPEALRERLAYIRAETGLNAIIPNLDAELPNFLRLEKSLADDGVRMLMCTPEQFQLRSKERLAQLGASAGISVPATRTISEPEALYTIHHEIPYPIVVKGIYYGAEICHSVDEAVAAFHKTVAKWGYPVLVQEHVVGEEVNVVALGDGKGNLVGAVPMKKTYITDKGKGWAGVAIKDPDLLDLTLRFVKSCSWRGPCEVEAIKDRDGKFHLIEINPRFPAWTYLSAGAGANLPLAALSMAFGEPTQPLHNFTPGTMFVRVSVDQIASLDQFQQIASTGEIRREEKNNEPA